MSDHGEHLGDHHLIYKCVVFDELIRVPSVWRFPGRFPADHRVSGFSSMIDVMPTLLNLAGIPAPPGLQGESLTDALAGKDWAGRRFVLIENDDVVASPALAEQAFSRTLRTEKYSINVYSTHSDGELYDLEADPGQLRNVWSDPAYSSAKSDLLVQLVRYSAAATFDATNVALGEV
jgi:arylsulfatase A-like enzyme